MLSLAFVFSIRASSSSSSSSSAAPQAAGVKSKFDYETLFENETSQAIYESLKALEEYQQKLKSTQNGIKNSESEKAKKDSEDTKAVNLIFDELKGRYQYSDPKYNDRMKIGKSLAEIFHKIMQVPTHTDPNDQEITFQVKPLRGQVQRISLYGKDNILTLLRGTFERIGLRDAERAAFFQDGKDILKSNPLKVIKVQDLDPSKIIGIVPNLARGDSLEYWNQIYKTQMGK